MNINFLIQPDKEKVIVSNKKGKMETREYQDNIKAILIKENIVKELESDYSSLRIQRTAFQERLEYTNKKIEKCKKRKKLYWKIIVSVLLLVPTIINIFIYAVGYIKGIHFGISIGLVIGAAVDVMEAIVIYFLINLPDSPFFSIKGLEEDKKEFENHIKELNLEIADVVQILTKNKAELEELKEQKEKNNIQTMSTEVQEISYRKALEIEKSYLTQLSQKNTITEQEVETKSSILRRFKKNN